MRKAAAQMMSRTLSDGTQVTVSNIRRANGVAGEVSVSATLSYVFDDGSTDTGRWELIGSVYGGPVVAVMSNGRQVFVRDAERFGSFADNPVEYMRRYALDVTA